MGRGLTPGGGDFFGVGVYGAGFEDFEEELGVGGVRLRGRWGRGGEGLGSEGRGL